MPFYCYTTRDGTTTTVREFPVGKAPARVRLPDRRWARRDIMAEHQRRGNGRQNLGGQYPLVCTALGVHPDEIPESQQFDSRHGVPTEYTPDGDPIMRDKSHYYKYRKVHGFIDRAGYTR